MTTPRSEIRMIPVDLVDPDPMNPQQQDLATFNELVADVEKNGMLESITVVPHGDGRFRLVAGEHRWRAAKVVGLKEVPGIVVKAEQWDEDSRRIQLVRMNVLKGKLDGAKFLELWQDLSKRIPDREELKRRMGFDAKDAALAKLVRDTAKNMPDDFKEQLGKRKDKIKSVEDLHATVNSLFAQYGATLESNFVVFTFLGQTQLMVRCTPQTFGPIRALAEQAAESEAKLDVVLSDLAQSALGEPV